MPPTLADLHLADPTRCPSCGAALTATRDRCPACALPLTGPLGQRLWELSLDAQRLLEARAGLITQIRRTPAAAAPGTTATPAAAAPGTPATPAPSPTPASAAAPAAGPPAHASPAAPRAEWSRHRVQNTLLGLGVGLLAIAAVIFVAVSWERLGVGGRSAVMAGVTALAGLAAVRTHRRGLVSTAEALSVLTVVLALLDCAGARAADLAGLGSADPAVYWAGALALVATGTALLAVLLPTRTLPLAAAVLGQLPGLLVAGHLADGSDHPLAALATVLTVQALAAVALVLGWPAAARTRGARVLVGIGGAATLALAALAAAGAGYVEDGSLVLGTALLLLQAATVAGAATVLAERRPSLAALPVLDGVASVLLVAAVWAPANDATPGRWLPAVLAGLGCLLLAAAALVPAARRQAPALVALAAALLPVLAAADAVSRTLDTMLRPLQHGATWTQRAGDVVVVADRPAAVVLAVAGLALVLGSRVLRSGLLAAAGVPALAGAAMLAVPAVGVRYAGTLTAGVVLGAGLLAAGALLDTRGRVAVGWAALASGATLLALTVGWALAAQGATLVTWPAAVLALLAGAAAARGAEALRPCRVALVTAAVLLATAEAGALARHGGAGWPATWALVLGLVALAAAGTAAVVAARTAVTDGFWAPLHELAVVVAVAAAVADVAALTRWAGVAPAGCGLAAAVAAALLAGLTAAPWHPARPVRGLVQAVAAVAAVPAVGVAALDGDRLWLALLAGGVGVAVVATTPERHRLGWVAGVVLTASSWVRLSLADVSAPEAYTVPGGVALVVVGALRRRRDPAYSSWKAYGSGLSLALAPSLLRAVTDAGDLRPLLLALAALGVLAVGARSRLQAPLLVGGLVLAVDALVQLAPYLAAVYAVVPRWMTIGAIGLALVAAGATYEQRVRDLRKVGRHVARLG